MYWLEVSATVAESEYARHREAHRLWLQKGFEREWFVFSGPKKNAPGGFILARDMDRKTLEDFISEDPFVLESVAEYQIQEFSIRFAAKELEALKSQP